eukprot:354691-Chlamydomonas_euryale.AAC.9
MTARSPPHCQPGASAKKRPARDPRRDRHLTLASLSLSPYLHGINDCLKDLRLTALITLRCPTTCLICARMADAGPPKVEGKGSRSEEHETSGVAFCLVFWSTVGRRQEGERWTKVEGSELTHIRVAGPRSGRLGIKHPQHKEQRGGRACYSVSKCFLPRKA